MKRILGLLLCVLSASVSAAEMTGSATVSVEGSVIYVKPRMCVLDLWGASDELLFSYRKNEIPNFYFLQSKGLDWLNQLKSEYLKYFQKIKYTLWCNYQPETDGVVKIRYEITKSSLSPAGNPYVQSFLSSAENPQAGFLIYPWVDNYWLNIDAVSTNSYSSIKKSKFIPDGAGGAAAEIAYDVAFVATPSIIDNDTELAPNVINAGIYTANLALSVEYY